MEAAQALRAEGLARGGERQEDEGDEQACSCPGMDESHAAYKEALLERASMHGTVSQPLDAKVFCVYSDDQRYVSVL